MNDYTQIISKKDHTFVTEVIKTMRNSAIENYDMPSIVTFNSLLVKLSNKKPLDDVYYELYVPLLEQYGIWLCLSTYREFLLEVVKDEEAIIDCESIMGIFEDGKIYEAIIQLADEGSAQ